MKRILLDVDTGLDDMVALLFAAGSPLLSLEGVVATSGNQVIAHTLENTINVLSFIERSDVPVYKGSSGPLFRPLVTGGHIHGENGIGDIVFPPCAKKAEEKRGVDALVDLVMENPGEITIVSTGPLTDIALAIRLEPGVVKNVREIVSMGGALHGGNITKWAEFNFFADPEAARLVLTSGANITLLPLDVTTQILLTRERLSRAKRRGGKANGLFCEGMDFYMKTCLEVTRECPAMHDPSCVAYLNDPEMFRGERLRLTVDCNEEAETYGRLRKLGDGPVNVLLRAEESRFWPRLEEAMDNLG